MEHRGRAVRRHAHAPRSGHFVYLLQSGSAALRRNRHRHQRPVTSHIRERRAVPDAVLRAVEQIEVAREAKHENVLICVYRAAGRLAPRAVIAQRELPQVAVAGRAKHLLPGHEARPEPAHNRVAAVGRRRHRAETPLVVVVRLCRQLARGLAAQLARALTGALARVLARSLARRLAGLASGPLTVLAIGLAVVLAALTALAGRALAALAVYLAAALAVALALLA